MKAKGYILRQVRILLLVATAVTFTGCTTTVEKFIFSEESFEELQAWDAARAKARAEWKKNPDEWTDNAATFLASQCVLVLQDQPVDRDAFLQAGYLEVTSKKNKHPPYYKHLNLFKPYLPRPELPKGCYASIPNPLDSSRIDTLIENVLLQNGFVSIPLEKGQYLTRYKDNNVTVKYLTYYENGRLTFYLQVVD
jgi:hypothetical protein